MKKIVKRRRVFRINNPLAFGILCAMILLILAGGAYALASGVIAPAVRLRQLKSATPTPVSEATPAPSPEEDAVPIEIIPAPEESPAVNEPVSAETPVPETETQPEGENAVAAPGETENSTEKLAGRVIGIDPARGYSSKVKGVSTGIYANRLNYAVASIVKEKLESEGAKVVMGLSDVKSNRPSVERADIMNKAEVEFAVRLECNFSDGDTRGAIAWIPVAHTLGSDCEALGKAVLDAYIEETGLTVAKYEGKSIRAKDDDFLKANAAPACTLIMGYISNATEDALLNDADFQARMAEGIVKGIKNYLGVK